MKSEKYTATQNPEDSIYEMLENDFQCKNTDYGVLVTIETVNGKEDVLLKNEKVPWCSCQSLPKRIRRDC